MNLRPSKADYQAVFHPSLTSFSTSPSVAIALLISQPSVRLFRGYNVTMFDSVTARNIEELVRRDFEKEYYCHLQFALEASRDLGREFGGDPEVLHIAAIAHDIGRVKGGDNEHHAERGAEMVVPLLKDFGMEDSRISKIASSIRMHNRNFGFKSIEEEITSNADCLSKLLAHDSFLLMAKSDNYVERAKWGLKYVEKGYKGLTLPGLSKKHSRLYDSIRDRHLKVISGR